MSIITDALNRLQAERARRAGKPLDSATRDRAETGDVRDPELSVPPPPARTVRNRLPLLLVVLGGVGIAGYLWGLPLIAAPDRATTEPATVKALHSAQAVPPRSVEAMPEQEEASVAAKAAATNEDLRPRDAVSASGPRATTNPVANGVPARKPRSFPGVRSAANPPPARHADSASSRQRNNRSPSLPGHAASLQVKLTRAHHFIQKRRYAQAVAVLQPLFVEPPERWEPWFWLGTAQLGLGQWEKARASLVEGLARDATVPQLWVQRALVSQQQGRFGEALDALRQAELLAPKLPEVHLNLAYALDVEGNRPVAVKHYRTFLTLTEGQKAYHATRKKVLDRISRLGKT